jgi:branched-chain amino acid aminotransferase
VLTPIGVVRTADGDFTIGNGGSGERTEALRNALVDIQRGRAPDTRGWVRHVGAE